MADPRRLEIVTALKVRLEEIEVRNGFLTNAGRHVYVHEAPAFGPDDECEAIAILIGEDVALWGAGAGMKMTLQVPLEFWALAKADVADAWKVAERILGDIKQALELEDRRLGGLINPELTRGSTRTLPREPGQLFVGVAVGYRLAYNEIWGAPAL